MTLDCASWSKCAIDFASLEGVKFSSVQYSTDELVRGRVETYSHSRSASEPVR